MMYAPWRNVSQPGECSTMIHAARGLEGGARLRFASQLGAVDTLAARSCASQAARAAATVAKVPASIG